MAKTVYITTTGTQDPVVFNDLGKRSFAHPTTNFNLTSEYKIETIRDSDDFSSALTSGYITAKFEDETTITSVDDMFSVFRKDEMLGCANQLRVKQSPGYGEFSSIAAAVATISDAADDNRYAIHVCPGTYSEPEITLPSYVFIVGEQQDAVVISPDGNHNIINFSNMSGLVFATLDGAPTGYVGLNCINVGDWVTIHKVSVWNCDTGCLMSSTTMDSYVYLEYVDFEDCNTNCIKVTNTGSYKAKLNCENLFIQYTTSDPVNAFLIDGTVSKVNMQGAKLIGSGLLTGNGIRITNGGYLNFSAGQVEDWARGIYVDSTGSSPYLKIQSIDFDDNTVDFNVDNATCTGFYSGDYNPDKMIVNDNSIFYIANIDKQIITVSKQGGQFSSVKDAVDSITDSSISKRYMVYVGPGVFTEDTITMKQYVYITGVPAKLATIIEMDSSNPSNTYLIDTSVNSAITNCFLRNAVGSGRAAVKYRGDRFRLIDCRFGTNTLCVDAEDVTGNSDNTLWITRCSLGNDIAIGDFAKISDSGDYDVVTFVEGANFLDASSINNAFTIHGTKTKVFIMNSLIRKATGTATGTALRIYNGASIRSFSSAYSYFNTGIHVDNIGSASNVLVDSGIVRENTTYDLLIEDASSIGSIVISSQKSKISVVENALIGVQVSDVSDGSLNVSGEIYTGDGWSNITNITPYFLHNSMTGVVSGGVISVVSGLTINVTSGDGYVSNQSTNHSKYITWDSQNVTLTNNTDNYLYIDGNGVFYASPSLPSVFYNIILSKARANNGSVIFLQDIGTEVTDTQVKLERTLRLGFGPIYNSGSLVTENTLKFHLDVSSGRYYYGTHEYVPSGGTDIIWTKWYRSSEGGWITGYQQIVDNVYYDNNSSDLYSSSSTSSISQSTTSADSLSSNSSSNSTSSSSISTKSGESNSTMSSLSLSSSSSSSESTSSTESDFSESSISSLSTNSVSSNSSSTSSNSSFSGSGDLTPIPSGKYVKHAFYIVNDGTNETYHLVYGQEVFDSQNDADNGDLPTPPSTWTSNIVRIASIVVQQGALEITEVRDERPRPSFVASATASVTRHGDLSGLGNDDHLLYLPIAGTRSMTGDLNMGTKNIANVGTVDGVDVSSHASRHLPSGSDALTTAAPSTNLSVSSSNSEGTDNSYARSDHSHAITTSSSNTASTIVARDASGNFSAGTITASFTGNLTGNADTATEATDSDAIHVNVANEIHGIANKASPVGADELVLEDSADSWNKKRVSVTNLIGSVTDADAVHVNVAGEINGVSEKVSTVAADIVIIEDSADSYNKKKAQLGNLAVTDSTAIHDNVSGEIHAITLKNIPVAADELVIEDSASSWAKKRVTITSLPVTDQDAIHDNVSGEINSVTVKSVPATTDIVLIEDSAASYVKKKATITSLPVTDTSAIHTNVSGEINGVTSKTTLVKNDLLLIEDSEASNAKKKATASAVVLGGTTYYQNSSEGTVTSTSLTWANAATFTFNMDAGTYLINFYYENNVAATNRNAEARIQIDATTTISLTLFRPGITTQYLAQGGMHVYTATAGNHSFTFDQQVSGGAGTVNIRAMRICLVRLV